MTSRRPPEDLNSAQADGQTSHRLEPQSLEAITLELKTRMAEASRDLVESGQLLIMAKQLLGHGQFRNWLGQNFHFSAKTANRLMSIAQMVKKLGLEPQQIALLIYLEHKALYELAAKSTSEPIQRQVLEQLVQGNALSYALIRRLKLASESEPKDQNMISDFTRRMQQFGLWFKSHQGQIELNSRTLSPELRGELSSYARQLKQASAQLEELLVQSQTIDVTPEDTIDSRSASDADPITRPESTQIKSEFRSKGHTN